METTRPDYALVLEGRELTSEAATALEKSLVEDPEDLDTRVRLLGFYGKAASQSSATRKQFEGHSLWLIERFPGSPVCGMPMLDLPPSSASDYFAQARKLWLEHCRGSEVNVEILLNAAQFFTGLDDLALAEELLERAETLEPRNTEVKNRLGRLHENAAKRGSPSERTDEARLALTKYEEAFRLLRDRDAQFSRLPSLARAAFEAGDLPRAKRYASRAISDAEVITNWAQGNCIHYGHEILGRIAFAGGELELAAKHLLDAGRTPGSPQLNSFGPSFELANELLEAGDVDSVLHYLELVRRFWQFGGKAIERWEAQLRAGERPRLDRAGALPR